MGSGYPAGQGQAGGGQHGSALSLTLGFPAGGFLYRATSPRLRIDGTEVKVSGWGTHEVPVSPGRHQIDVWVPYALPRKAGRARTEVTVRDGELVALEYMAPTLTFMRAARWALRDRSRLAGQA